MRKILIRLALCPLLFALCVPAEAQQTGKVPRIGFLGNSTASGSAVLVEAFRQELSKLGWIEGKNITFEYRFAENKGAERSGTVTVTGENFIHMVTVIQEGAN